MVVFHACMVRRWMVSCSIAEGQRLRSYLTRSASVRGWSDKLASRAMSLSVTFAVWSRRRGVRVKAEVLGALRGQESLMNWDCMINGLCIDAIIRFACRSSNLGADWTVETKRGR